MLATVRTNLVKVMVEAQYLHADLHCRRVRVCLVSGARVLARVAARGARQRTVWESVSHHYHIGRLSLKSTGPRIQAGTIASPADTCQPAAAARVPRRGKEGTPDPPFSSINILSYTPRVELQVSPVCGTTVRWQLFLASTKTARSRCRWFSPSAVAC